MCDCFTGTTHSSNRDRCNHKKFVCKYCDKKNECQPLASFTGIGCELDELGHAIKDTASNAVNTISTDANHVGHAITSTASHAVNTVSTDAHHVGHAITSTVSTDAGHVKHFITNLL